MTFSEDLRRFSVKLQARNNDVFVNTVAAAHKSITDGSPVTGAPGQLVDTGHLKASWITEFESPTVATISTNVVYAPQMEDGTRDGRSLVQHSPTGGFHSVALTIAGMNRIIEDETRKLVGNDA